MSKTLTILTPCYNEEENVREVYQRVRAAVAAAGDYKYEHIFIDNASTRQHARRVEGDCRERQEREGNPKHA